MYALHCPYDSKRVWIWHISDATFVLQTNQSCWTDVIPVSFSDALYMLKNKRFMPAYDLIQPTARAPARCCGIGWTRRSCPGATHDLDACVAQRRYTDATAHWALSCLMLHCVAWLGYMAPKKNCLRAGFQQPLLGPVACCWFCTLVSLTCAELQTCWSTFGNGENWPYWHGPLDKVQLSLKALKWATVMTIAMMIVWEIVGDQSVSRVDVLGLPHVSVNV